MMRRNATSPHARRTRWSVGVLAMAVLALLMTTPALRWLDIHVFGENLKDAWGRWRYAEDWSGPAPLPRGLDYRWLQASDRPILIAHALGSAGQEDQNSLGAQQRALRAGFKLLEIDVWLDEAGRLRCHHGPIPPVAPTPGECSLAAAAHAAAAADAWLVLDIKTDFQPTGEAIFQQFRTDPSASRLIFQLYRPADIGPFAAWAPVLKLPGPIVTAYRARRSLRHIAGQLDRLGIQAFTFPIYRGDALPHAAGPPGTARLVHPVHDCAELGDARRLAADGVYVLTAMLPRLKEGCAGP